jgi:hypothetical protein
MGRVRGPVVEQIGAAAQRQTIEAAAAWGRTEFEHKRIKAWPCKFFGYNLTK